MRLPGEKYKTVKGNLILLLFLSKFKPDFILTRFKL